MKKDSKSEAASSLRQQAEELLRKKTTKNISELSETEMQKALHELAVYQIELEMQNTELMQLKSDAEVAAQKYIDLYDFAPSGYFTISKAGEIIELNHTGASMMGKERGWFKKNRFAFFLTDETKSIFNTFLENVFNSKGNAPCEVTLLASENDLMHIQLTGTLNRNRQECLVVAVDITERKEGDQALKESEEKHRLILDSALDAIIFIDANSNITLWNPQAEKIFGWTATEVIGKTLMQTIIPSVHKDKHMAGMKKYSETGVGPILNKAIEITALNKKVEEFPIELSIVPVNIEKSQFFCAFIRDITERKKAEGKLIESNQITKSIIDNSNSVIYLLNTDGEFIIVNRKFEEVMGVSSDFVIGKTREEFFPKEISDQHRQNDLQVINAKQAMYFEEDNPESDGLHFYVTAKFPLFTAEGEVYAVGGISTDVTESKKAALEYKKLNEELEIRVKERTAELVRVNNDLQDVNDVFVGNQVEIIELKKDIKELKKKLEP